MNRQDLQKLPRTRAREAKVLLDSGRFSGSYYPIGYAVECAIKSAIAKQYGGTIFRTNNSPKTVTSTI